MAEWKQGPYTYVTCAHCDGTGKCRNGRGGGCCSHCVGPFNWLGAKLNDTDYSPGTCGYCEGTARKEKWVHKDRMKNRSRSRSEGGYA